MKTKLFLLVALVVVLFSFASIRKEPSKKIQSSSKSAQNESKGLAMEDKDQFN